MNDKNERNEHDELHEKLCAYVLGEASDEVRNEVEAALAASPELQAEQARLEATIGFVQKSLGDGSESGVADQLSPAASAALMAAAEAVRPTPILRGPSHWYSSPALKLAAGIGLIGLTYVVVQSTDPSGDTSPFDDGFDGAPARVAQAEKRELSRQPGFAGGDEAQDPDGLQNAGRPGELGRASVADASPDPKLDDQLQSSSEVELEPETLESLRSLGYLDSKSGDRTRKVNAQTVAEVETPASPGGSSGKPVLGAEFDKNAGVVRDEAKGRLRRQEGEEFAQLYKDADVGARVLGETLRELGYVEADLTDGPADERGALVSQSSPSSSGPSSPGARRKIGISVGPVGAPAGAPAPVEYSEPFVRNEIRPGEVLGGHDDFYLGHGSKEQVTGADFENKFSNAPGTDGPARVAVDELAALGYISDDEDARENRGRVFRDENEIARVDLRRRFDFVIGSCQRRPKERPRDMFFRFWGDNPFQYTVVDGLSTFSVDVDTASYALARRYLSGGTLPGKAQIRTEEFVNYFDADVPAPLEETFAIHSELAPSRFGEAPIGSGESWMLRVAVRGKDVSREERQPLTLTFVIDVSGSMKEGGRLELVKHALRLLLSQLDARDSISIVAFSNEARVILPMTSARHGSLIETAVHQLQPEGGTNAEAGLLMGYELARAELTRNSHNRVVLLSDGVANIGRTDQASLSAQVDEHRRSGIYLNTVGVGMGNHNDALLEQLADKGDGVCNYVDDAAEARRALVDRFTGAFEPIARDVKIQVEFDPAQVQRYRLLGYENRAIADRDFRNDAVDAGEVNAGHQVVALYELSGVPTAKADRPMATVRLRWKRPHVAGVADIENESAAEAEHPVAWGGAAGTFAATSQGYRLSVLVGQFAEFLRRSQHARHDSLDELLTEARALAAQMSDPDVSEFAALVERSHQLILAERAGRDDLARALDTIREASYLQAQLEDLNLLLGHERLFELEEAVRRLQERIRFLKERVELTEFQLTRAELQAFQAENARLAAKLSELLRKLDLKRRQR